MTWQDMDEDPSRLPQQALAAMPEPGGATTPQELVRRLRAFKAWSGNPSLRELERRTGLPRSTVSGDLSPQRSRLPPLQRVLTLATAFGASAEELARWRSAWQCIQMRQQSAEPPVPAPHAAVFSRALRAARGVTLREWRARAGGSGHPEAAVTQRNS
ncbi:MULTISPECIES: helix-turn-helix domain-containing protein [unclassified Kitasatospora]|uniref:helix-turn-helix domain-containing protein n=1 Tax=unclassified Kitasatospora TaxID=2633591 RepID=UPI0024730093|nr:helix-turn-helix transcriptional regulator [Kitasatospora sp. MAP12-44]